MNVATVKVSKGIKYDADLCRKNGWTIGDCLIGGECGRLCVIMLTGIGHKSIMAVCLGATEDGGDTWSGEYGDHENWTLSCRDWKRLEGPDKSKILNVKAVKKNYVVVANRIGI